MVLLVLCCVFLALQPVLRASVVHAEAADAVRGHVRRGVEAEGGPEGHYALSMAQAVLRELVRDG